MLRFHLYGHQTPDAYVTAMFSRGSYLSLTIAYHIIFFCTSKLYLTKRDLRKRQSLICFHCTEIMKCLFIEKCDFISREH